MIIETIQEKIKLLAWMIVVALSACELAWLCCHWRNDNMEKYRPVVVCAADVIRGK